MSKFTSRDGFLKVYEELRDELIAELPSFGMTPEVAKNLREVRIIIKANVECVSFNYLCSNLKDNQYHWDEKVCSCGQRYIGILQKPTTPTTPLIP